MESALATTCGLAPCQRNLCRQRVSARGVTPELVAMLNRAGPFGSGNPEPVIALPSHQLVYADEVGKRICASGSIRDGSIVNASRSVDRQKLGNALTAHRGQPLHVAGSLAVDRCRAPSRAVALLDVRCRIKDRR